MSFDFFQPECQESAFTDTLFGLCDDEAGDKAYSTLDNPERWIATVKNERGLAITFTAIDKCVIKDGEAPGKGRCDGMLTTFEHLYFVELKDQGKNWMSDAIEQLESTVQMFLKSHGKGAYRHRKAFACNKAKAKFQQIDNEQNLRFFRKYGFRFDAQAEVVVV